MPHDPLTLAYMAGVIDSDGFITINQSTRKGKIYFGAVIGVAGTRRQPHDIAAGLWGGKVREYVPKNPRHRNQFQWQRQGDAAAVAINDVLPFLRVKEEQAWLALECQEKVIEARSDDPFPWFCSDYDHIPSLLEMREEMIVALNQDRHAPLGSRRVA